jgi:excisionase family DNA binding protein
VKNPRSEIRNPNGDECGQWFTRLGLAVLLQVSVCTVDRMKANGELPFVRLRGRVRFYLPDVVEALRNGDRKFGRHADTNFTSSHEGRAAR